VKLETLLEEKREIGSVRRESAEDDTKTAERGSNGKIKKRPM
jgi:hypothetical protein